ncbi:uncharacterized protein LOC135370941 isoform X2 [Ornithodoros turicata]|uniref:uncharacterized protein LOC135370941 isoform X2 n=1 Tax=Ornithodoros turicata TaxID=34597 RepID=UPI00313949FF
MESASTTLCSEMNVDQQMTEQPAWSAGTPKRRKTYLDANAPFVVPVSTIRYKRVREDQNVEPLARPSSEHMDTESSNSQLTAGCAMSPAHSEEALCGEDDWTSGDPFSTLEDNDAQREQGIPGDDSFEDSLVTCLDEFGRERLPHSSTTKAGAVAMLMSLVVSNGLTWKALGDIIDFVNKLFEPETDVLPRSKYLFRKLWSQKTKQHAKFHHLCSTCESVLTPDSSLCQLCGDKAKVDGNNPCFVIFNLEKQLKYVVGKTKEDLHRNLRTASSAQSIITDMTSAAGYKALREKVGLRESDLTLTVNTDGSPLFESSKTSVWPVQFVIDELPPRKRFSNCTLAGLWCSKSHPDMSVFLSEFVTEVNSMEPVLWEEDGCKPSSRSFVLCCAVDAPARAAVLNMKQHNGYSSCTWCLITCSYVDNCMRYISSQPVEQRTSELLVRDGELSLELDTDINGVKGPTPMMYLPGFDLVRGCSVEYMHSVLLGVARQLNDHLFGSSHSVERYYIVVSFGHDPTSLLSWWVNPSWVKFFGSASARLARFASAALASTACTSSSP